MDSLEKKDEPAIEARGLTKRFGDLLASIDRKSVV